jgi:metal-dependent HD superfamily phosphatase/phosphodiesterase
MLRDQQEGALTPHARFGNWLATTLIRLIWKVSYTDLGPFRAIKREALHALRMRDRNYGWTIEMQIKAIFAGLNIKEVNVSYRKRIGRSKVSGTIKGSLLAGAIILRTIFIYWRRNTV